MKLNLGALFGNPEPRHPPEPPELDYLEEDWQLFQECESCGEKYSEDEMVETSDGTHICQYCAEEARPPLAARRWEYED